DQLAVALDLGAKAAPEDRPRPDDEAAAGGDVEREARADVDRALEADIRVPVLQQHPVLAQLGHQQRPAAVAGVPPEPSDAAAQHIGEAPLRGVADHRVRAVGQLESCGGGAQTEVDVLADLAVADVEPAQALERLAADREVRTRAPAGDADVVLLVKAPERLE